MSYCHSKREYLLSQIRQKDAIIESLLKQLHNPYLATPLSIAAYRMSTAPPDQQNQNVKQWLERLQSSIRTHNGPNTLKGAASRSREMVEDASDESDNEDQAAGDDAEWEDLDDCLVTSDSKLIPDAAVPLGLFADLSLDQARSTKAKSDAGADENKDGEDDDVGVANETYFLPGPATDLRMRAKLIESYSPPEILLHGLVTPDDVDKLFDIFFKRVNIWLPLLDPVLHTPSTVFARCPFLFTCICAISSRYSPEKSEIYSIAMHFAKSEASNALIHGWKTVELCQAYLLMSMYGVPAKRWEEDRSWLYTGLAIRIAMDLNLHVPPQTKPQNERQEREVLNRTRAWMLCFNQDRSTATQFGKPWTIKEDYIIRNAGDFYKTSRFNSPYDIHMCGYNQLLRLLGRVHSDIYSDPSSPLGINQHADLRPLIMNHDHSLNQYYEEWQMRFDQDSDPNDPVCVVRAALLPYVINYSRLVMWSFPFQQAFQRGISADDQLVFTTCMNAAKSLIRVMIERLVPTGLMRYSPDGWFLFSSFASAFLLKLLRPEFAILRTPQDEHEILEVISRLIQILSSPEIALDDRHAPKLYARFLAGLLTKHRQDGMVPQDRQTPQPPHHQVQYGTGNPGGHQMQPSASNQIYSLSQQQGAYGGGQDYGAQQMSLHSSLPPVMLAPPEDDALLSAVSSNPGSGFGGSMDGTLYPPSAQPSPGSPEMTLASMQAIKNPAWWESMMMPG
ncbi:hypothetical protein PUNSTDRAFT_72698 [Punctularia strigosozonata HHB-11173 SS5]|uniref:uncharacterized protein n=1 Tax=Punctularia strigosozonata (strain HHB-11173) TaxID=741275 RepID=UPI00044177E0|nr:uncharacterized protein PUNSTDRAFT_72698 [Punctularia strigosozonata HHB-11173 SS5]EIN06539.1 hypothetical protein PUNSTDRAFT_72698 [Punctularia strigosozonata HHB-11173 SS5]